MVSANDPAGRRGGRSPAYRRDRRHDDPRWKHRPVKFWDRCRPARIGPQVAQRSGDQASRSGRAFHILGDLGELLPEPVREGLLVSILHAPLALVLHLREQSAGGSRGARGRRSHPPRPPKPPLAKSSEQFCNTSACVKARRLPSGTSEPTEGQQSSGRHRGVRSRFAIRAVGDVRPCGRTEGSGI